MIGNVEIKIRNAPEARKGLFRHLFLTLLSPYPFFVLFVSLWFIDREWAGARKGRIPHAFAFATRDVAAIVPLVFNDPNSGPLPGLSSRSAECS